MLSNLCTHLFQYFFVRNNRRIKLNNKRFRAIHDVLVGGVLLLSSRIPHDTVYNSPHAPKVALRVPESSARQDGYLVGRRFLRCRWDLRANHAVRITAEGKKGWKFAEPCFNTGQRRDFHSSISRTQMIIRELAIDCKSRTLRSKQEQGKCCRKSRSGVLCAHNYFRRLKKQCASYFISSRA